MVQFRHIQNGEFFSFQNRSYQKRKTKKNGCGCSPEYNAIDQQTGKKILFQKDTKVTKVGDKKQ